MQNTARYCTIIPERVNGRSLAVRRYCWLPRCRLFRSHSRSHYRFGLGPTHQAAAAATLAAATPEDLIHAHARLRRCIIQDMGIIRSAAECSVTWLHYVRSGDFVRNMVQEAQDLNEYAFALALWPTTPRHQGHSIAVNVGLDRISQAGQKIRPIRYLCGRCHIAHESGVQLRRSAVSRETTPAGVSRFHWF